LHKVRNLLSNRSHAFIVPAGIMMAAYVTLSQS
jgi:hypothetical protein